jgi:hypothetical protein
MEILWEYLILLNQLTVSMNLQKDTKEFRKVRFGSDPDVNERAIVIRPFRITKALLLVASFFLLCHIIAVYIGYYQYVPPSSTLPKLVNNFYKQFHLASEGNIATYYSSLLLITASLLLFIVFKTETKKSHWLVLSTVFLFLSIDESAQLHENFANPVGTWLDAHLWNMPSYLSWGWVVPYAAITLFTGLYFLRFTLQLPKATRNLFVFSAALYVFAALILEMFEAHFELKYGLENLFNQILFPIEEILEMAAVILFIYALMDYLQRNNRNLRISFSSQSTSK